MVHNWAFLQKDRIRYNPKRTKHLAKFTFSNWTCYREGPYFLQSVDRSKWEGPYILQSVINTAVQFFALLHSTSSSLSLWFPRSRFPTRSGIYTIFFEVCTSFSSFYVYLRSERRDVPLSTIWFIKLSQARDSPPIRPGWYPRQGHEARAEKLFFAAGWVVRGRAWLNSNEELSLAQLFAGVESEGLHTSVKFRFTNLHFTRYSLSVSGVLPTDIGDEGTSCNEYRRCSSCFLSWYNEI